ncbi:hypothetical protein JTB14_032708 [Gonioctena quinquepunctata]|nr:hypothetical protein JTB14_032708 [Gonioctena quinquepunctata]
MPEGVRTIAFADDLVIFVEENQPYLASEKGNIALRRLERWMRGKRNHPNIQFLIGNSVVMPGRSLTYLGVVFDDEMRFTAHVNEAKLDEKTSAAGRRTLYAAICGA